MSSSSEHFEQLLQARLAGQSVEVPGDLAAELEQAVAAHAALRHLLEPTAIGQQPPEAARTPPAVSPDYVIEREIGQGGMGVVYLARQRSLNRAVALKVLRPGQQTFGPLVDRFLHEAQHLAQLRHPHIVAIHEVGQAAGEPYFTMDYVDGEPLTAILARGPLTPSRAIDILKQVAAAVQYAHRHGIIHRDLKPGNVLLDRRGHAFVTDFGLARNVHHDARLTQTGELLGTPQYMAPEQARGQSDAIGEATDIHALGLLLFEMLTGRAAFLASSPADVLVKLLHEEPPPARSLDRRIPRDLETICAKCLQKSPGARYANVSALLEDIRRYENGEALSARPTGWLVRTSRWCRRRWRVAATALAAAALTLVIASQLFDRSFDDLVAWGDEELASGHVDVAAQVYSRALKQASAAQQGLLVERIAQTCRGLDDPQAATKLALQILPIAPDISFGPHNFLVAQALVSRERARSPSGAIDIWRTAPTSSLKLVQKRLEMAQAGGLSSLQELEAEQTLTAIKLVLSQSKPVVRFLPDYLYELPQGGPEELAEAIDDEQQPIWNRARAAIALGRRLEASGQSEEAIARFQQALAWVRQVYPMFGGVKASSGAIDSQRDAPDAEECQLVRQLVFDLHRLAPATVPLPKGGIEFELTGAPLPAEAVVELVVELSDPSIDQPDAGLPHHLPRLIPLRSDQPVRFQVLDGKYRLRCRSHRGLWRPSAERAMRLLQVETDDWPQIIEVRGQMVRLPPVRLRQAEEMRQQAPADGDVVDLAKVELRWQAIEGAATYNVQFLYTEEKPSPSTTYFLVVKTTQPQVKIAELTAFEQQQIRSNLHVGREAGWQVDAYDAAGKRIGLSPKESHFVVGEPLPEPAMSSAEARR